MSLAKFELFLDRIAPGIPLPEGSTASASCAKLEPNLNLYAHVQSYSPRQ